MTEQEFAPHPLDHLPDETVHEWLRTDCAALDAARQEREDNLMNVIIQTSSAAVLAIPALFVASDKGIPPFADAWAVYLGILSFGLAFACACAEQVLSGWAYQAQRSVVTDYYAKKSTRRIDERAVGRADLARNIALAIFAIAVSFAALGLAQFARGIDGKAPSTPTNSVIAPGVASAIAASKPDSSTSAKPNSATAAKPNCATAAKPNCATAAKPVTPINGSASKI